MTQRSCRRSTTLILATLILAALAPLAAMAQSSLLRVRLQADIRSTDPGVNRDANTDTVMLHMVEGLVGIREDTSIGPLLANRVDLSNGGKTYTFKLRDGVVFHNGAPLAADDVVWAWRRYLAPATQWRCLPEFDGRGIAKIVSVDASDTKTVVFTLDNPSALFLTQMARPDCGGSGIYHRTSVGPDGKWKEPIGTGPFKLGEWKRGQYVDLLRFDRYTARAEPMDGFTGGKRAEVDRVRFMVIPDSAAAKAALLSHAVDLIPDIAVAELGDLNGQPNVRIDKVTTAALSGILLQTRDPLLKDVRIRRALALAIDSPALVRGVTNALARPNNSAVPETSPFYTAVQATGFKSDLAQAKKLLAEAGYTGQPIKMLTNKRYQSMFDTALLAQALAAKAGIKLEVEVLDWAAQLDRYTKGDYQAMAFSYSARLDPSLAFDMFTGPKDTQPRKVWDNREVQALVNASMQTADKAKRQALFDELHRRLIDEVPMIPLYNGLQLNAVSQRVSGFRGWAGESPRVWNVRVK
ncbi:MAG: ABC transporter substrate-binding protein [Ideonella sp.]|nr:ABC transporter substrate-binding protein [Ideonella sp.]